MSSPAVDPDDRSLAVALLAAVKYTKDDEDEAGFGACWASDARLEITSNGQQRQPLVGRATILAFYRTVWSAGGHGIGSERETHVAEHPHIVMLAGGRLLARHASAFFAMKGDLPQLVGFGEFRDELIKEDGHWRIALRQSRLMRRS